MPEPGFLPGAALYNQFGGPSLATAKVFVVAQVGRGGYNVRIDLREITMMTRFTRYSFCTGIVLALIVGCSPAPEPVGEVNIDPEQVNLTFPGYTPVRLHWKMTSDLGPDVTDPMVFVHILDSGGGIARTYDHPLPGEWAAGREDEYMIALYQSALAPSLPDGTYRLTVGLYDGAGMRWPLVSTGGAVAGTEHQVGEVVVDSESTQVPTFFFSPSWLTLEAGSDAQVLGRRWFADESTIRVANLPGEGSLWLRIRIPKVETGEAELILNEGETEARVDIAGSCSATETAVVGVGSHEVRVQVGAGEEGLMPEECELALTPNFRVVQENALAQRSAALELLAWSPAS